MAKPLQSHLVPLLGTLQAEMNSFSPQRNPGTGVEKGCIFYTTNSQCFRTKGKRVLMSLTPGTAGSTVCPAAHEKSPKQPREFLWQALGS